MIDNRYRSRNQPAQVVVGKASTPRDYAERVDVVYDWRDRLLADIEALQETDCDEVVNWFNQETAEQAQEVARRIANIERKYARKRMPVEATMQRRLNELWWEFQGWSR